MPQPHTGHRLALAAGGALLAASLDQRLTVRRYRLYSPALAPHSKLRLVLLSDLHGTVYGGDQTPLIRAVQAQRPHLILMPGDILDEFTPPRAARLLLRGLRDTAPVYFAPGNHEYWCYHHRQRLCDLESWGARVLRDRWEAIRIGDNRVVVAGVEDPAKTILRASGYNQEQAMDSAFARLEAEPGYRILLAHRPDRIAVYRRFPFHLVVSGHAHGGQARIPFLLNGLIAPNQGLFPPYAGGLYRHGGLDHIVGRGLVRKPALPRFFNPPEVVRITVCGGQGPITGGACI